MEEQCRRLSYQQPLSFNEAQYLSDPVLFTVPNQQFDSAPRARHLPLRHTKMLDKN